MRGRNFCSGVRADGESCGVKLPSLASGIRIRTRCHHHRSQTYEQQREIRERAAKRRAR